MIPNRFLGSTSIHNTHVSPTLYAMGPTSIYVCAYWEGVSFPPDSDITDSNICLFVAVLFFADKNMLVHCWMGS